MGHSAGLVGIGSIILGVLSFLCMIAGIFLVWVPFLGAMLGFLSPVLAVVGIILGGVALSRARGGGSENESLALGGLITSVVAFIPGVLVAITCSMCSACWTGVVMNPLPDTGPRAVFPDAGAPSWAAPGWPPPPSGAPVPPTAPPVSGAPPVDPGAAPPADPTVDPSTAPTAPAPTTPTEPSEPVPSEPSTSPAPGSSGPALPPPPLPPGPNVRSI